VVTDISEERGERTVERISESGGEDLFLEHTDHFFRPLALTRFAPYPRYSIILANYRRVSVREGSDHRDDGPRED
jgi:hypothetical protein